MNALLDLDAHPVIAHRGDSVHFPENTLEAFGAALAAGADALELDVRLSRDGVPVVIHDATVDRTTSGSGAVAAMSYAELTQLDAGARFTTDHGRSFEFAGRGIAIPRLREVVERFRETPLLIELKVAEAAVETVRILQQFGATGNAVLGSFDRSALVAAREKKLPTTACFREALALLTWPWSMVARTVPYSVLSVPLAYRGVPLPIGRLVALARTRGVTTHVWTVDDPEVARGLWRVGVAGIVSNAPASLVRARDCLSERP